MASRIPIIHILAIHRFGDRKLGFYRSIEIIGKLYKLLRPRLLPSANCSFQTLLIRLMFLEKKQQTNQILSVGYIHVTTQIYIYIYIYIFEI